MIVLKGDTCECAILFYSVIYQQAFYKLIAHFFRSELPGSYGSAKRRNASGCGEPAWTPAPGFRQRRRVGQE